MATVTAAALATRIGVSLNAEIEGAFSKAETLLSEALTGAFRVMPDDVQDECLLSIGYAVWDRKKSSHGASQLTTMEGQAPVRAPRDPLASVRSIIANYVLDLV